MLVCVITSCLSVEALANETTPTICAQLDYVVNPLYKNVVIHEAEQLNSLGSFENSNEVLYAEYDSVDAAAEMVRDKLKDRTASFTVNMKSNESDYNALLAQIIAQAMEHTGVGTEGDYLFWHYHSYGGNVEGYKSGTVYHYTFSLQFTYYTNKAQEDELTAAVEELKDELDVYSATDYKKIKAVYDYLCENIVYDNENVGDPTYLLKHSAYSALVQKVTVCQGYATLFYRLMLELGVDCRLIAGLGDGEAHGWNIVELDNLYYNLDATWDAAYLAAGWPDYHYFLKCDANFDDHVPYDTYLTESFVAAYPKATADYDPASAKPEFEIVDGVLVSYNGNGGDVVIPEGVTAIGDDVFCGCDTITSVTMPDTVESIGDYAFDSCTNLESITLSKGLKTIGDFAFCGCVSLTEITIPKSVESIGHLAFFTAGLVKITFLSKTTAITDAQQTIPSSAVIYGYDSASAQRYAKKYSRTFVILEAKKGDLDSDGVVTRDDAIYLLYHSMFPSAYPLSVGCDYNNDGVITRDDAVYLLYHSMFPSAYPL